MRTLADELREPKYARIERERRWLVDLARRPMLPENYVTIEDRYIAGTRTRLRRMTAGAHVTLKLTKKYDAPDPAARPIVTAYLSEGEFGIFAGLPAAPLTKRRYRIDGFILDVFLSAVAGLELAEIERDDAGALAAIELPRWIGREVTDDPRYTGAVLAVAGRPES